MKAQTLGDTSSLEFMRSRRVFEINPEHPIIKNLNVCHFFIFAVLIYSSPVLFNLSFFVFGGEIRASSHFEVEILSIITIYS